MALKLVKLTKQFAGQTFRHICEIGCGCGVLTSLVVQGFDFEALVAVDRLDAFGSYIKGLDDRVSYIKADVSREISLHFKPQLVISNAVFHWIDDFEGLLNRLRSLIDSEGYLVFSSFSKGNLSEIAKYSKLHYFSIDELQCLVSKYFELIHISEETATLHFASVQELLRHFRYTGVNCFSKLHWTRRDLLNFKQSLKGQMTLTFKPLYVVAKMA